MCPGFLCLKIKFMGLFRRFEPQSFGVSNQNFSRYNIPLNNSSWQKTITVDAGTRLTIQALGGGLVYTGVVYLPVTPAGTSPITEIQNDETSYGGLPAFGYSPWLSIHSQSFYGTRRCSLGCLVGVWVPEGSGTPGYSQTHAICIGGQAFVAFTAPTTGTRWTLYMCVNWPGNYYGNNSGAFDVFVYIDAAVYVPINTRVVNYRNAVWNIGGDVTNAVCLALDDMETGLITAGLDSKMIILYPLADNPLAAIVPFYYPGGIFPLMSQFGMNYTSWSTSKGVTGVSSGKLDTIMEVANVPIGDMSMGFWLNTFVNIADYQTFMTTSYAPVPACYMFVDPAGLFNYGLQNYGGTTVAQTSGMWTMTYVETPGIVLDVYKDTTNLAHFGGVLSLWQSAGTFLLFNAGLEASSVDIMFAGNHLSAGNVASLRSIFAAFRTAIGRT